MNGNERTEITALTKQVAEFQVAVTKVIVPREEIDRRENNNVIEYHKAKTVPCDGPSAWEFLT